MKMRILTDTHTHKNKPVPKGEVIEVDEVDAKFLVDNGVGEPVTPTKKEG
jgi:hypothetical protein